MWERFKHARWRIILQAGLVPVSVGLIAASALVLARTADISWVAVLITVVTAAFGYFTRVHPLWMFALAAALGYAGLV
jgi:chromate transporter